MHTPFRRAARSLCLGTGIAAASAALAVPAAAAPLPLPPPPDGPPADRLTVMVSPTGRPGDRIIRTLECHPTGGTHPRAAAACGQLDGRTRWGTDPFAPTAAGQMCTQEYGGPATARIEGRWAGRPVRAEFDRSDGCEAGRWDRLSEVLSVSVAAPS